MIHKPELYNIDPENEIFKEAAEFLKEQDWYVGATGMGAKYGACEIEQMDEGDSGLIAKLNPNGTIKDSRYWDNIPKVSGVWRAPFGWDDESVKRRAPKIWALFDYINSHYFNNAFTIDGYPEEIAATRKFFSPKYGDDPTIPEYGTVPPPGEMPAVWTCYGIAKTGGPITEDGRVGKRINGSVGIHRDAVCETAADADGYFSILVNMNEHWKPSWGGDLLYYETLEGEEGENADEHHFKRGYAFGYASEVAPHKPHTIIKVPAAALHTAANDKFMPQRGDYIRRIMFRCRYIDLFNDDLDETV